MCFFSVPQHVPNFLTYQVKIIPITRQLCHTGKLMKFVSSLHLVFYFLVGVRATKLYFFVAQCFSPSTTDALVRMPVVLTYPIYILTLSYQATSHKTTIFHHIKLDRGETKINAL